MTSFDFHKSAFEDRIRTVAGGKIVHWNPTKDYPRIEAHINSMPLSVLRRAAAPAHRDVAMRSASHIVTREIQAGDLNFLWVISRRVVDLVYDVVENVNTAMFNKNNPIL